MIDDIKLIEKMDKLLEVCEDPNYTAEQNLMFVMGAVRGIQRNAEKRIEEFEAQYAPQSEHDVGGMFKRNRELGMGAPRYKPLKRGRGLNA